MDVVIRKGLLKDLHTTMEQGGSLVAGALLQLSAPARRLLWPVCGWIREPNGHGTYRSPWAWAGHVPHTMSGSSPFQCMGLMCHSTSLSSQINHAGQVRTAAVNMGVMEPGKALPLLRNGEPSPRA